jgi:hypothetical protein
MLFAVTGVAQKIPDRDLKIHGVPGGTVLTVSRTTPGATSENR